MTSQTLGDTAVRPGSTPGRAPAPPTAKRGRRFAPAPLLQKLATLVVVLLVWQWFAKGPGADADFPTPLVTLQTAGDLVVTRGYWEAVLTTITHAILGFVISVAIGVPIGLAMGIAGALLPVVLLVSRSAQRWRRPAAPETLEQG